MPKSERPPRLQDPDAEYYYRRPLRLSELWPAIGIGIGAGFFAFYITRLLMQRTPLKVDRGGPRARRAALEKSARA